MRIRRIKTATIGGRRILSARVSTVLTGDCEIWFAWRPAPDESVSLLGDAFLCAMLIPAMALREDVYVDGAVSSSLLTSLRNAKVVLESWNDRTIFSRLEPVDIRVAALSEAPSGEDCGLFFTGGVDSLYSALAGEVSGARRATKFLCVHGFDFPDGASPWVNRLVSRIDGMAQLLDRGFVQVETNLRRLTDPLVHWELAHGGGLAAVGHALSGQLN